MTESPGFPGKLRWPQSKALTLFLVLFKGKTPTDTHIKQVCMRVMQGKNPPRKLKPQTGNPFTGTCCHGNVKAKADEG